MFRKMVTFLLVVSIFTSQAFASGFNELQASYDDLSFALTVEWDGKDEAFYKQQLERFSSEVQKLKSEGLTDQGMMDFAITQVKDERLAKDMKEIFGLMSTRKMTSEEARTYLMAAFKKSYGRGASWTGDQTTAVLFTLVAVLSLPLFALMVDGMPVATEPYDDYGDESWDY